MGHASTATTPPLHLDDLPIEVIHRIAAAGSCRAVLCLAAVNRRLRSICYEPLIFKELIESGNGTTGCGPTCSKRVDWWELAVGSDRKNTNLTARWALADELALEATRRSWASTMDSKTLEWLVSLLIVGHPLGRDLSYEYLGPGGYRYDARTEIVATAAFFFAYQMSLSSSSRWLKDHFENLPLTLSDHAVLTEQLLGPFSDKNSPLGSPIVIDESHLRRNPCALMDEGSIRIHARVMTGLGVFAPLVRSLQHVPMTIAHTPPEAYDIPFASLIGSSPPFCGLSDMAFTSQYVGSIVNSSFLEDGEWVGFYCHSTRLSDDMHPRLDPEMKGIHFKVVGEDPGGALLVTSSNGQDSIGHFQLWGSISPDTGLLRMFKSYQGGHPRWLWQGALTPFGMAGSWGDESYGG